MSLFSEDPEGQKLNMVPGADELLADYHDKVVNVCKETYEFGKNQFEQRQKEVEEFWKCLIEAKNLNTEEATNAINIFTEWKKNVCLFQFSILVQQNQILNFKQIIEEIAITQEQSVQESKLNEYGEEVNKLWEKLMYLEVVVVDQIEV